MNNKGQNIIFTIGIDTYESPFWKNLNNATNDCDAVESILVSNYNFERSQYSLKNSDATFSNVTNAFTNLRTSILPEDNIVIFFAGHGNFNHQTNRGYWVPHEGTNDLSTQIPNSLIKDWIQDFEAKHIFLISDSCYSGSFLLNTRGFDNLLDYSIKNSKKSRWMFASGSIERVKDGQPETNSPFTSILVEYLSNNDCRYFAVSELIDYVTNKYNSLSGKKAIGAVIDGIGDETGEMVFELISEKVKINNKYCIGRTQSLVLLEKLKPHINLDSQISCHKEILLVTENGKQPLQYLILENYRFKEDGSKKLSFSDDNCELICKDGSRPFNLVQRFASMVGLERFILSLGTSLEMSNIVLWPANEDIDLEIDKPYNLAYKHYVSLLMSLNSDFMRCLHCDEKISTNDSVLVEIDEDGHKPAVGNVHKYCLRPANRVLGNSGYKDLTKNDLINFDYTLWSDLLPGGQGQISPNMLSKYGSEIRIISWNNDHIENIGPYCIKQFFEDGSSEYINLGKKIHRFKDYEIDTELKEFNDYKEKHDFLNDPAGICRKNKAFGNKSSLEKAFGSNLDFKKSIKFEKKTYSKQLESENNNTHSDFAPITLVQSLGSKKILKINEYVPLITKPLDFALFLGNWKKVFKLENEYTLKILKSDEELGNYLNIFWNKNLIPVINPVFSDHKQLEKGFLIQNFNTITGTISDII